MGVSMDDAPMPRLQTLLLAIDDSC
jgi:hypothetical protein